MNNLLRKIFSILIRVICEMACFAFFAVIAFLIAQPLATLILILSNPNIPAQELQRYADDGGPGQAMMGGWLIVILMIVFYKIRRLVENKLKKHCVNKV